jgi:hypothetical protein
MNKAMLNDPTRPGRRKPGLSFSRSMATISGTMTVFLATKS